MRIVLLCGGVGGSKLALGLSSEFPEHDLTIIVNTADDLEILDLHISPDLDTVMYTLAGCANPMTGWGLSGDTFQALRMLEKYGRESWFQIGDADLATHLLRTSMLREGASLTQVTRKLSDSLEVHATVLPMCDQAVRTWILVEKTWIPFQDYFVKRRQADIPKAIQHRGIKEALVSGPVREALTRADIIIVAPSNPVVSIGPIISIPGMAQLLRSSRAPKVAVTPIVGNQAVAGPAAELMRATGLEPSVEGVATAYRPFLTELVVDETDPDAQVRLGATGMRARVTDTMMPDLEAKKRLARFVVEGAT